MSMRPWTMALCAAIVLVGATAHSDGASPAARAAEIYKRANALYDAGKLEAAEKLYREAWGISKSYDIASNLGAVMFDRGEYREAAEYLSYALANFPAGGKTAERVGIEKALSQAKTRVATLHISVNVAHARVLLDGKPIGEAPVSSDVFVDEGKRTVEAQADGYVTKSTTIEAKAGQASDVKLELVGVVPSTTATASASAAPTNTQTAVGPSPNRLPFFVAGGAGIASLIVGGVLVGIASSADGGFVTDAPRGANGKPLCWTTPASASQTKPECDAWRSKLDAASTEGNAGVGLLVAGGVLVAGAALYRVLWPQPQPKSGGSWSIAPVASSSGAGIVAAGRF